MGVFYRGDLVRLTATLVASGAVISDATSVYVLLIDPAGNRSTYLYAQAGASITRTGVGAYYKDIDVEVSGDWRYRVVGTGGLQTAAESTFTVQPSFAL